ncbi:MAG: hypothetical protein LBD77_09130 [Bifidobacteriaceae bacterium]|nr:hypothetical protein [Bifidobacteriaceae bacterium]
MRRTWAAALLLATAMAATGCGEAATPQADDPATSAEPPQTLKATAGARHSLETCEALEQIERLIAAIDGVEVAVEDEATDSDWGLPVLWGSSKGCSPS